MTLSKVKLSIIILSLFYGVGFISIGFQLMPDMVKFSWANLLLTALVILWNATESPKRFYLFLSVVFLLGLTVEIIGVATGFPFGIYRYGASLGWKVLEVPIILGLNWWILVYASIHSAAFITKNKKCRIIMAPALMLGMDFMIEPVCATLDFWYWKNAKVPFQNYLSWYVIALVFVWMYYNWFSIKKPNRIAVAVFLIQLLFFTGLTFFLK